MIGGHLIFTKLICRIEHRIQNLFSPNFSWSDCETCATETTIWRAIARFRDGVQESRRAGDFSKTGDEGNWTSNVRIK